jgi:hypothetical protein
MAGITATISASASLCDYGGKRAHEYHRSANADGATQ